MRRKDSRRNSHRLIIALITIIVIFFGLVLIFNKFSLFTIKKVVTEVRNIPCTDTDSLINSSNLLGEIIFKTNFKDTASKLKEKFYCIRHIEINYIFPSSVKISATGRLPAAVLSRLDSSIATASANIETIATPSAGEKPESFLVDDEGVIFSRVQGGLIIPELFVKGRNFSLGQRIQDIDIENTLKILNKITVFGIKPKKALIFNGSLIIFSDPKIIFKVDNKTDVQLASLQLILAEAKINLDKLEFIDLRFDKPIIRFAPKKNG